MVCVALLGINCRANVHLRLTKTRTAFIGGKDLSLTFYFAPLFPSSTTGFSLLYHTPISWWQFLQSTFTYFGTCTAHWTKICTQKSVWNDSLLVLNECLIVRNVGLIVWNDCLIVWNDRLIEWNDRLIAWNDRIIVWSDCSKIWN